jgi:dipeptidase E
VHYDGEPSRSEAFRAAVRDGMRPGYAADDGVALHFEGRELAYVVASRRGRRAFRVTAEGEVPLAVRYLGERELAVA